MESINCNAHTCPRKVPFLTSFTDEGLRLRKADLSKGAQQVRSKALFKLMGFDSKTFTCQHFVNCKSLLLIFKKIIWWTPTNFGYFITWTFRNVGFVILFVSFMCILTCFYLSLTCLLYTHAHTQRNIKIFLMSRGAFASASTAGCLAWEVGSTARQLSLTSGPDLCSDAWYCFCTIFPPLERSIEWVFRHSKSVLSARWVCTGGKELSPEMPAKEVTEPTRPQSWKHGLCAKPTGSSSCWEQALGRLPSTCYQQGS